VLIEVRRKRKWWEALSKLADAAARESSLSRHETDSSAGGTVKMDLIYLTRTLIT
jgi:hypothetical protein